MIAAYRLRRLLNDLDELIPDLPGVYNRHHARELRRTIALLASPDIGADEVVEVVPPPAAAEGVADDA